ncbi:MAG: DUF885 domain-containing protein [Acidimicrobiales bacterium]
MSNIFAISDLAVERWVEINPLDAVGAGFVRQPARWPDYTPAGHDQARAAYAELLDTAASCDTETADEALAKLVLVDELASAIEEIDDQRYTWDLNNLASPWQSFGLGFDLCEKETDADWEAIAHLLETLPAALDGFLQSLALGIELGFPPAKRQVAIAIEQGRNYEGENSPLAALVRDYDLGDPEITARLNAAATTARAGFATATDWLEQTLFPAARDDDGVGEARYAAEVKRFLGTELDLRATYDWAWTEIASLTERLTELTRQIDSTKTTVEVMELLKTDPSRAAHGVDDFLRTMQERQQTALENLAGVHFDVPDAIRTIAVKAPPEGGATAAYYTGPSADFSRPGCVWYPIYGRTSFPLYDEVTTAYHEGFPGHHLQIGFARTLSDRLSQFHQLFVWHPGSGEGWASTPSASWASLAISNFLTTRSVSLRHSYFARAAPSSTLASILV